MTKCCVVNHGLSSCCSRGLVEGAVSAADAASAFVTKDNTPAWMEQREKENSTVRSGVRRC